MVIQFIFQINKCLCSQI